MDKQSNKSCLSIFWGFEKLSKKILKKVFLKNSEKKHRKKIQYNFCFKKVRTWKNNRMKVVYPYSGGLKNYQKKF
jgi:hypothetical protein